ncbi:hypothetical protein MKX03_034484 [Papaver bracteatum]|nr:hypothetical protein MKX03_034484 [Papaver bracteatum]
MPRKFKQFDIISSDEANSTSDHYYVSPYKSLSPLSTTQIMKEWRILEKNLPDSIFVRVYEGRVDLLRAVIIGPTGTPYHDGLFFFDIQVPSNYPASPPQVYYRSFGHRLNPNLYANGYVCLSLLNTWNGLISQKWNPSQSTILQVLVSIQGLVLNAKPYFNEPDVFIMSCKSMMSILHKPPKSFEYFISQHFRDRASNILVACNAYINGKAVIGDPIIITAATETTTSSTSFTFKVAAGFLYPKLVDSFVKNGSFLESVELLDTSKNIRENVSHQNERFCICGLVVVLFLVLGFLLLILGTN